MSQAARLTGIALIAAAVAGLSAAHFLPIQGQEFDRLGAPLRGEATAWDRAIDDNGTRESHSWFGDALDGHEGTATVRVAAPILVAAVVLAVAAGAILGMGRRALAGIVGVAGSVASATGIIMLSMGIDRSFRAEPRFGTGLGYEAGFFVALAATLLLLAGSVFAFVALLEEAGPRRLKLPPRPQINVENPQAFNPMHGQDAKPFTPDPPKEYRGFEVTGGAKEFRAESGPSRPLAGPKVTTETTGKAAKTGEPAPPRPPQPRPAAGGAGGPPAPPPAPKPQAQAPPPKPTAPAQPAPGAPKPAAKAPAKPTAPAKPGEQASGERPRA